MSNEPNTINGIDFINDVAALREKLSKSEIESIFFLLGYGLDECDNRLFKVLPVLKDENQLDLLSQALSIIGRNDVQQILHDYKLFESRGNHVTLFNGFGFMCHVDEDRRKLHCKIDNFDFGTDKSVKIIYGGGESHLMNLAEWHKTSKSYYDRFFGCDLHKVITIPSHGNNIVETLRKWCSKNHGKGIIAEGYDLIEHFNFLGVNPQHITSVSPHRECYQRIIVFNYSEKVIFIIHKVNKMGESLNGELTCISTDIKLLVTLYKDELKGSGCKIIGLVVIKEDMQNLKMHCHLCKIFIVSDKIFRTLKSVETWWQKFEQWCEMKELNLYNANKNLFALISSKLLSFMANCKCVHLPNLTNIPASQVEQTHLLLTPEQIEILYSSEPHVCIRGNFGTGKSIVALKKIMLLSQTLKKNDIIYFVNYDQRSSFHREVEFQYKIKKQFKVLHNTSHLKLSDIFKNIVAEVSNSIKNIHLFIDEFNIEDLTASEATSLRYYLEQDIRFKYSCVWIIVQPVEKNRIFVDSIYGKHFSESISFTKLKDTLKVKDLTYVMRTTVQINKLAEVTKKFLENKQNHFKHSETGSLKSKDSISSYSENTLNDTKETSSLHGLCRVKSSNTRVRPILGSFDQVDPCCPLNLDEAFKQVSEGKLVPVLHDGAKVTTCSFRFMFSRIGHQIEGPKPNVFEPLQFTGKFENTLAVGTMLKLLSIRKKKTAILHFEQNPPEIVLNATQLCHEGLEISFDVDKFKSLNCKSCIFISNFHYVRGMEFDNVITLVDPDEYYLKHDIVECILRCRQNLSIVMIKDKRLRPPEDTVQGILDTWEKAGVVVKWNFAQCEVCDNSKYFHIDENAHTVYINMLSDENCKMRESFKLMQDSRKEEVKVKTTAENLLRNYQHQFKDFSEEKNSNINCVERRMRYHSTGCTHFEEDSLVETDKDGVICKGHRFAVKKAFPVAETTFPPSSQRFYVQHLKEEEIEQKTANGRIRKLSPDLNYSSATNTLKWS